MAFVLENGLIYVGDTVFKETDHSEPSVDDYGLDSLTRTYEGRGSLTDAFLRDWPVLKPDYQYTSMVVTGKPRIARGRAFTQVGLSFIGKVLGAEPKVRAVDAWRTDTIQAQGRSPINPDLIVNVILDYRAPMTTYEYCTSTRPTNTRFDGPQPDALGIQIVAKRGTVRLWGIDIGPQDASIKPVERLSSFTREQFGVWWKVTEVWEWAFVQQTEFFNPQFILTNF